MPCIMVECIVLRVWLVVAVHLHVNCFQDQRIYKEMAPHRWAVIFTIAALNDGFDVTYCI